MTKERVIKILSSYLPKDEPMNVEDREAFFIAIEALEKETCEDVISREEVLRELKGCLTGGETEYQYVKLHIDNIQSVNLQESCKDTVSREDANKLLDIISFLMEIIKNLQVR